MKKLYLILVVAIGIIALQTHADIFNDAKKSFDKFGRQTQQVALGTVEGLKKLGEQYKEGYIKLGKLIISPFAKPEYMVKKFKNNPYYGLGTGKMLNPFDKKTADWKIGSGCIRIVKAWVVEDREIHASTLASLTDKDKKGTDLPIIIEKMKQSKEFESAVKSDEIIKYHKFTDMWAVHTVTANENQCASHDFRITYDKKSNKISIK